MFAVMTLLGASIAVAAVTTKEETPYSIYHGRHDDYADDSDSPILPLHNYISQRVT
jgi:hypothetical protein